MKTPEHGRTGRATVAYGALLLLAVLSASWGGCKKAIPEVATGPKSFRTPESAGKTVYLAAKAGDSNAMIGIFGPEANEYLFTGDSGADKLAYEEFAADYEQMHRWGKLENGGLVLEVGVESYPFPFPLVKNAEGQWFFSSQEARKEILARQVGDNELTVLDVLNTMADAQDEYFSKPQMGSKVKQYARKFVSSEGKHDGLYWKTGEGEPDSPLGPLAARASAEGYKRTAGSPEAFHGYFHRILKQQGGHAEGGARNYVVDGNMIRGFAILAYPAEYRKSGVMTFLMDRERVVYQKDLGPETVETAKAMESFDPDESWTIVQ